MFVRCERCRSLYDFQPETNQPALRCARCGHVFEAPATSAQLRPQGTLGGAAALAYAPERWREVAVRPPPPLKTSAPPPARGAQKAQPPTTKHSSSGSRRALVLVLGMVLLGVGVAAGVVFLRDSLPSQKPLPPAVAAKMETARKLVLLDDLVSLEAAVATFADASTLAPQHPAPRAWRAVATTLLGASLKVEAAELTVALQLSDKHGKRLQRQQPPADPAEIELFATRVADLRQRIGPATQRGDKLLREGAELARTLAKELGTEDVDVRRALVVVAGAAQDVERIQQLTKDVDPAETDAWLPYSRGLARSLGNVSPQKSSEARAALEQALQKEPALVRAKWDLARLALLTRPPELDRASTLFAEVSAASPAHEGAKRGGEAIELLKTSAADLQADIQAADAP